MTEVARPGFGVDDATLRVKRPTQQHIHRPGLLAEDQGAELQESKPVILSSSKNLLQAVLIGALTACNLGPIDPTMNGSTDTGGSGGNNPGVSAVGNASGIPRTLALAELTSPQASVLCEWTNLKQGGYGQAVSCGFGRPESTDASNTDCVTASALLGYRCPSLTVANEEDCINATGTELCLIQASPACAPINACRS